MKKTATATLSRKKARTKTRGFRQILVPLEFTKRDTAAVDAAILVAQASGAATTLAHVVYVPDSLALRDLRGFYQELAEEGRAKLLRHAARFRRKRLAVKVAVLAGKPLEEILGLARDDATDLIVLSSHAVQPERPEPGWDTLSYKVAALCKCPVLLAK